MALFGDSDSKIVALVEKLERRVVSLESEVRVLRDEVQSLRSSAIASPSSSSFVSAPFPSYPSSSSPQSFATDDDRMRADPEVMEHIRGSRKINAIKRVRELTGLGLKDAKDLVERLE
ncbi:MAG: ribosomal protein L7/L12 [Deltaproteobacteria bacterium]|nr:ribosomal protein L7/L12 [Deltaproteobacteria bacterium]